MANAREDILAIEAATELLVRGLNKADISSITDLVMDTTLLLPPSRRTSRGQAVVNTWRNMAMAQEGIAMMSNEMDALGDGVVRDLGTLSMRERQSGERNRFRYAAHWQKVGSEWKLATLSWNREPPAGGGRRGGRGQGQGGGGQGGQGGGGGQYGAGGATGEM